MNMNENQKWNAQVEQVLATATLAGKILSNMYLELISNDVPQPDARHIVGQYAHGLAGETTGKTDD